MDGLHINSGSVLINTKRHGQRKNNRSLSTNGSFECSKQSIFSSMDKFVRTVQSMRGTILVPSKLRDMRLRQRLPDCQITMLANSAEGRSSSFERDQSKSKTSDSNAKHNLHSLYHRHHYHHLLHNHLHLGYHHRHSSSNKSKNEVGKLNYDPAEIPSALMNADLYNFYSMLYDVKQQLLWGPASGQSTIFTNYNTNSDLNLPISRFNIDKSQSSLNQLNSTIANCNLNSDNNTTNLSNNQSTNNLGKDNRAGSTCSSGYSSNSSTRNSTTNLSFIAQCNSPTMANCITNNNSLSPSSTRPPSSATDDLCNTSSSDVDVKIIDSAVSSNNSDKTDSSSQSKTPQSESDLESELESDSIIIDRTSEPRTDQTQLLASAFRHHLQALHTILDQLTHSAEYLSRSYELDLNEEKN